MSTGPGRPLPKFGEWDVKNPASAEGFTVIFQRARDDKKATGPGHPQAGIPPAFRNNSSSNAGDDYKSCDSYHHCTTPKRIKVQEVVRLCLPILVVAAALLPPPLPPLEEKGGAMIHALPEVNTGRERRRTRGNFQGLCSPCCSTFCTEEQ
ncbi:hypothetical protein ACP4OV_026409 [Aristida adscensionis]